MIEAKTIKTLADRYQTTVDNVIREYFQHIFLSVLYQQKKSESILFKGGTALRIIYQSPRFSEDLDFTGLGISTREIESLLEDALAHMEHEGIQVNIDEAKKTSGGYFGILELKGNGYQSEIQFEVSLRQSRQAKGMASLISSDFLPPYTILQLEEKTLVAEKVNAVLTRAKPRDFYDLYYILRSRLALKEVFGKDKTLKTKLLELIKKKKYDLRGELKRFLPVSQHPILRNFENVLAREIERNLP